MSSPLRSVLALVLALGWVAFGLASATASAADDRVALRRASLIECMLDPRLLVARYNAAATEANRGGRERLALWSPRFLKEIGAASP